MSDRPEMTPLEDVPFTLEFSHTECHGRIRTFAASEGAQVATELDGWEINVYNDVQFAYSIRPSWQHCSAYLDWEGETLLICTSSGYAVEVCGYEDFAVYRLEETPEQSKYLQTLRHDTTPLDIGNRQYFMEDGNLLFTENGSEGAFYIADNAELRPELFLFLLVLVILIPVTIQKVRAGEWKLPHKSKEDSGQHD